MHFPVPVKPLAFNFAVCDISQSRHLRPAGIKANDGACGECGGIGHGVSFAVTGDIGDGGVGGKGLGDRRRRVKALNMFYTYITASSRNGNLYTGHTDNVFRRAAEHKAGVIIGWARDHNCKYLVWYEEHATRDEAFKRERRIKKWDRAWKLELIEGANPAWLDISKFEVWPPTRDGVKVEPGDYLPSKYDAV